MNDSTEWPDESGPAYERLRAQAREQADRRTASQAASVLSPTWGRQPEPPTVVHLRRQPMTRVWAEQNVLGGWAAYLEARACVLDALNYGRAVLRALDVADEVRREDEAAEPDRRRRAVWAKLEQTVNDSCDEALSFTVGQRDGESDADYSERLFSILEASRARVERPSEVTMKRLRAQDARASEVAAPTPPSTPAPNPVAQAERVVPVATGDRVYVLTRAELRALRRRVFAEHGRKVTPADMAEEARRLAAAT